MRRIRRNPSLLIVNPQTAERRRIPRDEDGEFRIDIDDLYEMLDDDQLDMLEEAIVKFTEFHGTEPTEIIVKDIPVGEPDQIEFFVGMGRAPAESYDAEEIEGSSKRGSTFVHPYGEESGERPLKVMSRDGKMVLTLPGEFYIDDWMRG